jgi:WD40 repeat protein
MSIRSIAFGPDGQHIFSGSGDKLAVWSVSGGKEVASLKVWSVCCEEGGCVADWTHGLGYFGRLQFRWATYRFWKWRQIGKGVVVKGTLLFYYILHYFQYTQIIRQHCL